MVLLAAKCRCSIGSIIADMDKVPIAKKALLPSINEAIVIRVCDNHVLRDVEESLVVERKRMRRSH